MTEFYVQGDKEREIGVQVSFGCDRENPIPEEKMQAGFIIGIVRPVFIALSRIPKVSLAHCIDQLDRNLKVWQDIIQESEAKAQSQSQPTTSESDLSPRSQLSPPIPTQTLISHVLHFTGEAEPQSEPQIASPTLPPS